MGMPWSGFRRGTEGSGDTPCDLRRCLACACGGSEEGSIGGAYETAVEPESR